MDNNLGCHLEYLLHRTIAQSSHESDDSRATNWTVAADPGKCWQTDTKLDATLWSKSQTPEVQEAASVINCNAKVGSQVLKNSSIRSSNTEESHMPGSTDFVLLSSRIYRQLNSSPRMKTSNHPDIPILMSETPHLALTKVNGAPLDPFNTKCHPKPQSVPWYQRSSRKTACTARWLACLLTLI